MANIYWTFTPTASIQAWVLPKGIVSFKAQLWGAAGGCGEGAPGGAPSNYLSHYWSVDMLANTDGKYTHPSFGVPEAGSVYGSNLGGYCSGTYNAPITDGAPTWPSTLYLAVGSNGANAPSSGGAGVGGWPDGGNGGAGNAGSGGFSVGYSGGGGGGGSTSLLTSNDFSAPSLVAGAAGGSGGGQTGAWFLNYTYGSLNTPTTNPPWSTYTGINGTPLYLPNLPYEAVQQGYVYNNGSTFVMGGFAGGIGGCGMDGASLTGGTPLYNAYGGAASTSAGGPAGTGTAASGVVAATAGAKMNSTSSSTARGGSGAGTARFSGGGGGGGGYYQGGGGGAANFRGGGGGGGGSTWASTAAVGTLPAPTGVVADRAAPPYSPSAAGGPTGTGGFALITARAYPLTPKTPYEDDSSPLLLSVGVDSISVPFTFRTDAAQSTNGNVQMQAYRFGVSTDGGTTITWSPTQALSTPGGSSSFVIGVGSPVWNPSATGTYDLYIDTQDTGGDWNTDISGTLNACAPAHFQVTVYTPPAAPVVTIGTIVDNYTDANGVTGEGVPVSWTHPGGTPVSSIVSLLDSAGAVVNTITISGSTASTTLSWPNGNALGNKATVQYAATAGEYSTVGSADFDISIDPPAQPTVSMILDSNAGTISLLLEDGGGTYPAVKYDVFRSVVGQSEIRIAAGLRPNADGQASFTDVAVATDTQYAYKIRAYSQAGGYVETTNGTVTGS
jgi:hypothetical protein